MEYHKDRFNDYSLLVYKDQKLFGLLPANITNDTVVSHQGLTYGGFVVSKKAKVLQVYQAFRELLAFLNSEGIKTLDMRVIPSFYATHPSDELEYVISKFDFQLLKRDCIHLIDLGTPVGYTKSRKEAIRKGKRFNLTIKEETSFASFWNTLLIPNLQERYGTSPVHTLSEIENLAQNFSKNIKHFNIYKEDELLAGTTVFLTKTTIHPQYVAASKDRNKYEALDVLYDFIIHNFPEKKYFDFNTSSEENGRLLNKNIIFWKESYGARTHITNNYLVQTASYTKETIQIK